MVKKLFWAPKEEVQTSGTLGLDVRDYRSLIQKKKKKFPIMRRDPNELFENAIGRLLGIVKCPSS